MAREMTPPRRTGDAGGAEFAFKGAARACVGEGATRLRRSAPSAFGAMPQTRPPCHPGRLRASAGGRRPRLVQGIETCALMPGLYFVCVCHLDSKKIANAQVRVFRERVRLSLSRTAARLRATQARDACLRENRGSHSRTSIPSPRRVAPRGARKTPVFGRARRTGAFRTTLERSDRSPGRALSSIQKPRKASGESRAQACNSLADDVRTATLRSFPKNKDFLGNPSGSARTADARRATAPARLTLRPRMRSRSFLACLVLPCSIHPANSCDTSSTLAVGNEGYHKRSGARLSALWPEWIDPTKRVLPIGLPNVH